MPEPRMMKMPNGGVLCVDVTLLHFGLSRCRTLAASALASDNPDHKATYEAILNVVRETLHGIDEEKSKDEVTALIDEH